MVRMVCHRRSRHALPVAAVLPVSGSVVVPDTPALVMVVVVLAAVADMPEALAVVVRSAEAADGQAASVVVNGCNQS